MAAKKWKKINDKFNEFRLKNSCSYRYKRISYPIMGRVFLVLVVSFVDKELTGERTMLVV